MRTPAAAATAYAAKPSRPEEGIASRRFKVGLVCVDCVLIGFQPIWVHMSKNAQGAYSYNPIAVNLVTEVLKTCISVLVLTCSHLRASRPDGTPKPQPRYLRKLAQDLLQNRMLLVPAGLYAVNNYLKFIMQLFFTPTTAKMLGNLKIFTIALLLRLVMHRSFSVLQWQALFLLVAGITVNQLTRCGPGEVTLSPGVVAATLASVTIPAAASVYNEFTLKRNMEMSVHLQNTFMFGAGACFNAAFLAASALYGLPGAALANMFDGFTGITWVIIVNNAAQGMLSTFFFKFADTILKKYSSTIATSFTSLLSWAVFGHEITSNFMVGIAVVFVSMHQFFGAMAKPVAPPLRDPAVGIPPTTSVLKFNHSPSMEHLQLRVQGMDDVSLAASTTSSTDLASVDLEGLTTLSGSRLNPR